MRKCLGLHSTNKSKSQMPINYEQILEHILEEILEFFLLSMQFKSTVIYAIQSPNVK